MDSPPAQAEAAIRAMLEDGVAAKLFPGAVALVGAGRAAPLCVTVGAHTYEAGAARVGPQTLFDLASLTKALATTTAVLQLADRGLVALSDPVGTFLVPFRRDDRHGITLSHLLTHTSGLRADVELAQLGGDWSRVTPSDLWDQIDRGPLSAPPGERRLYSDLGFLLLGRVVELVSGVALDAYADAHIFGPLGMAQTRYRVPSEQRPAAAPTEYDARWRGGPLQGVVHDEKAFVLGGVAGHAGLFSTAADLHVFLRALLDGPSGEGRFPVSQTLTRAMTQNQTPALPDPQGLGWFLDQTFLGGLRSHGFGHTGFTGVSLAADPVHDTACVLLTNCVHPTRPDAAARRRLTELRAAVADFALSLSSASPPPGASALPLPATGRGACVRE